MQERFWALVPCAGSGSRFGSGQPKQYQRVAGAPMVVHTLRALVATRLAQPATKPAPAADDAIRLVEENTQSSGQAGGQSLAGVLVVVSPGDGQMAEILLEAGFESNPTGGKDAPVFVAACGGPERAITVLNGLKALAQRGALAEDWVLVHDAARCLIQPQQVARLVAACREDAVGGLLAQPLADTLKEAGSSTDTPRSVQTIPRAGKWLAQTPQMFRLGVLMQALQQAGPQVTDEASAIEAMGLAPKLVAAGGPNFKVTYPEDMALAEQVLMAEDATLALQPTLRIGEGWDTHALVPGRPLILGGVNIPFDKGLDGHSDADALLHAITDAILGAAALGDIGRHFPDTDARFKGADSRSLLAEAAARVRAAGFELGNVDATVIAQAPKLAGHIEAMRASIADTLGLQVGQVNVKAKTAEKMGPVGEGRAMEARAVALLLVRPQGLQTAR